MIFIFVLLCLTTLKIDAADPPVDFQELYDRLLLETINERIQQAEQFLTRLTRQLTDYQKTKSAELRDTILEDISYITPLLQALDHVFQTELKRTDIDILQKFALEKADSESRYIIEALGKVKTEVDKVKANPPVIVNKTIDWRLEYDQLLFELVEERTTLADTVLLRLQTELTQYKQSNSSATKEAIIDQVDIISPLLREAETKVKKESTRTDLNNLEKFLFEKANSQLALLLKHYAHIETIVKNATLLANYKIDSNPALRENVDMLLFELLESNVQRADRILLQLFTQYQTYLDTKDKTLLTGVVEEIEFTQQLLNAAKVRATEVAKRTDLNDLEVFVTEKILDDISVLTKHFATLEKDVKAVA